MVLFSCSDKSAIISMPTAMEDTEDERVSDELFAQVVGVEVTGEENLYTFNVTLKSPDTGCDQYADWWEIFDVEEELQYRRILAHSHVNEQPFARSGGPVRIPRDQMVYIRGHMNNVGYGTQVFGGTVATGFTEMVRDVKVPLEKKDPLPDDCYF